MQTLAAFVTEAGLPEDAGDTGKDDLTLEKVLQEKSVFDITLRSEKVGEGGADGGWSGNGKLPLQLNLLPHKPISI